MILYAKLVQQRERNFSPFPLFVAVLQFRFCWCLHNGLFRGKLGLIHLFRQHIIVEFWTLLCPRRITKKCTDFLIQYLDKIIVHILKIREKSLLKIRMANYIHRAPACRCLHFYWYRSDGRIRSVRTMCYHFSTVKQQTACLKSST